MSLNFSANRTLQQPLKRGDLVFVRTRDHSESAATEEAPLAALIGRNQVDAYQIRDADSVANLEVHSRISESGKGVFIVANPGGKDTSNEADRVEFQVEFDVPARISDEVKKEYFPEEPLVSQSDGVNLVEIVEIDGLIGLATRTAQSQTLGHIFPQGDDGKPRLKTINTIPDTPPQLLMFQADGVTGID